MNKQRKRQVFEFSKTISKAMYENNMQERRLEKSKAEIDHVKHRARYDINSQIYALRAEVHRIRACTPNMAHVIMENGQVPLERRGRDPRIKKIIKPKEKESPAQMRLNAKIKATTANFINELTPESEHAHSNQSNIETETITELEDPSSNNRRLSRPQEHPKRAGDSIEASNQIPVDENDKTESHETSLSSILQTTAQSPRKTPRHTHFEDEEDSTKKDSTNSSDGNKPRKSPLKSQSMYEFGAEKKRNKRLTDRPSRPSSRQSGGTSDEKDTKDATQRKNGLKTKKPSAVPDQHYVLTKARGLSYSESQVQREIALKTNMTMSETLSTMKQNKPSSARSYRSRSDISAPSKEDNSFSTEVQRTGALLSQILKGTNPFNCAFESDPNLERRNDLINQIGKKLDDLYATPPPWTDSGVRGRRIVHWSNQKISTPRRAASARQPSRGDVDRSTIEGPRVASAGKTELVAITND